MKKTVAKMFITLLPCLMILLPGISHAAARQEKVRALMEAQGMTRIVEEQMVAGRKYARDQAHQMMSQVLAGLSPNSQFKVRFDKAMDRFIETASTPVMTPAQITAVWGDIYGKQFSDAELDQLIAYYTSPLGRKDVEAARTSMTPFMEILQQQTQPQLQRAIQEYIQSLKSISQECRCQVTASK